MSKTIVETKHPIGSKVTVRGFEGVGPATVVGHTDVPVTSYEAREGTIIEWFGHLLQWNTERPAYYSGADIY